MIDSIGDVSALCAAEDWNVRQALAWLRWRNEERAAEYAGRDGADRARRDLLYDYSGYRAADDDSDARRRLIARTSLPEHMTAEAAAGLLLHALRCGKCCLFRNGQIVPALYWRDEGVRIGFRTNGMIPADQVRELVAASDNWIEVDRRRGMAPRRLRWINRFLNRQRGSRTWIGFAEIARAIARELHPDENEDAARARAYADLAGALRAGAGEMPNRYVRGRCGGVLQLNPIAPFIVLTAERFDALPNFPPAKLRELHLAHCYVHIELARIWHERGDIRIPEALLGMVARDGLPGEGAKTSKAKRKSPGRDYREQDRPLVAKMREMIRRGEARNATDAARQLAKDAPGAGSERSKVTRLVLHYNQHAGAEVSPDADVSSPGQD